MFQDLPVDAIRPNPRQPRAQFDEAALRELADSITAVGVLQPVLVRPIDRDAGTYELVAGERRLRASRLAGRSVIPAIIRDSDDASSVEQALVENLHRQDLTPLEEAAAFRQLLEDFRLTHEQLALRVGRSRTQVTNSMRLLALPPSIQQLIADRRLSGGHARALLGVEDRRTQETLARRAAAEGWSVRATEEAVRLAEGAADRAKLDGGTQKSDAKKSPTSGGTATTQRPAGLLELERLLGDHLATTVSVSLAGGRGKVVIEFADLDDLERIYRTMIEGPSAG
jgi:ParB family chromosome partitioning protein